MGFFEMLKNTSSAMADILYEVKKESDKRCENALERWAEKADESELRERIMSSTGKEKFILGRIYKRRFR